MLMKALIEIYGENNTFGIKNAKEIQTNEQFINQVKINNMAPTITWDEVQNKIQELTSIETLKKLREIRDSKLRNTDQYVLPDFPLESEEVKQSWLTYRQALRDLPANSPNVSIDLNTGKLIGVTWPVPPS